MAAEKRKILDGQYQIDKVIGRRKTSFVPRVLTLSVSPTPAACLYGPLVMLGLYARRPTRICLYIHGIQL